MKTLRYWFAIALAAMPWTAQTVHADGSDQPQIQTPEQQEQQAEQAQQQGQGGGGG